MHKKIYYPHGGDNKIFTHGIGVCSKNFLWDIESDL